MEVSKISTNFECSKRKNNSPAFCAGINAALFNKLEKSGGDFFDLIKKTDDIYNINNKSFTLADGVYSPKEKTAEFFLTAVDMVKSIPGLDSIRSRVVKARGNNLADAFQNLNMNELKKTNNMLAQDYKKRYSETEDLRAKLKIEREAVKSNLKQKFDNADGFWNKFYRQLDARKK